MKTRTILLTLALCFVAGAACFASDLQMGTWKLNEAKSKLAPGMPKNNTVVYEAAGDNVKVTVDGTDNDGKPAHNEWTGKFDGKDYAVTGDPNSDERSYNKIDDRTLGLTVKKGGKVGQKVQKHRDVRQAIAGSLPRLTQIVMPFRSVPDGRAFVKTASSGSDFFRVILKWRKRRIA